MSIKFTPIKEFKPPVSIPYDITLLKVDGTQETRTIKNHVTFEYSTDYLGFYLVPKTQVQTLFDNYVKDMGGLVTYKREVIRPFLDWLDNNGHLAASKSEAKDDWLENKLNELGIQNHYSRVIIDEWFNNPERYPDVPFDIGNKILTTMPSGGGKVVVLPTGHTIAYTYARDIYHILCGAEPYGYHVSQNSVSVREYVGNGEREPNRTRHWSMKNGVFEIGCQRIPVSAIEDLAAREGWSGKIKAKYL